MFIPYQHIIAFNIILPFSRKSPTSFLRKNNVSSDTSSIMDYRVKTLFLMSHCSTKSHDSFPRYFSFRTTTFATPITINLCVCMNREKKNINKSDKEFAQEFKCDIFVILFY